jgi:hypothetical protein
VNGLKKEVSIIKTNYETIQRSVDFLASQQEIVNGDLAAALGRPDLDITLTSIRESGGNMIIQGNSPDETNVLLYARYLDKTSRFSSTTVSSFQVADLENSRNPDPAKYISFTISLQRKGK